jgi:endoglucanase
LRSTLSRRLVALAGAAALAISYAAVPGEAAAAHRPGRPLTAQATVAAMQPGWNLGNTFDAVGPDETAWGNPRVTEEFLENLKAQGFKSIRIPVTWDQHLGEAPDYQIDPEWLARVQEVVGWALEDGLYVMINMHHDSWLWVESLPTQHDTVLARYTAVWTQVAETFRDASPKLLFESINEPFFNGSSGDTENAALIAELNTTFHDVVRASGGNNATRLLVLPTLFTADDQIWLDGLLDTITGLDDPNLVATFHFYGFWPFSVNIAGFTRFDETVQQDLTDRFDRVHDALVAAGIPVILGEYGLLGFDRDIGAIERGEKLKFFEFFGHYARASQFTTMLWDNGQHFGRTAFEWNDPDLYRQIRASWIVRSGTASTDLVFVGGSEAVADQTVTLNPNGNRLVGLFQGRQRLIRGRDYTVSGDQLTFSAALLARLTSSGEYGVNAVLTARFSRGASWKFQVITFDPPVLAGADGTTDSFVIPAAFNGDLLATMEARYADGSNAGPQDWTSFKEFDWTFAPDYQANELTLRPAFFDEVNDDAPVTLTFHFWSGATVEYTVTKSGTTVTGSA